MLRLVSESERDDRLLLHLPAAWSCTWIAWLPPRVRAPRAHVRAAARRGLDQFLSGATRQDALLAEQAGQLGVLDEPSLPLTPEGLVFLRRCSRDWDERLRAGGSCLDVVVTGDLAEPLLPLWASLAAASGIAAALGGVVLDVAWPRMAPGGGLKARLPDRPTFVLTEHVLVLSSLDGRGTGTITTLGLRRFGLPELIADRLPSGALRAFAAVLNGMAWRLLDVTLRTPPAGGERIVEIEAQQVVSRGWIDAAAGGRIGGHSIRVVGADDVPAIRMGLSEVMGHEPWIRLAPPVGWRGGRPRWARALVDALGLPWAEPLDPQCGHAPGRAPKQWDA